MAFLHALLPEHAEEALARSLSSWAVVHGGAAAPGSEHPWHAHNGAFASGVYFLAGPEGSGALRLQAPWSFQTLLSAYH